MSPHERFKGCHFPSCDVLQAVYYYLRFALNYRDIEEILLDLNVPVDHATIQRWVVTYSAILAGQSHIKIQQNQYNRMISN
ncbi:IS6 family transposase [Zooshikella ganghwensis]|uniref:IS6 family transposase n=1 Tax=Zooshikella ganghwensis TaxID=202772 RepID=UPI00056EA611|nr:IS6 family transposase [Zooshikella ganghwensis]